MLRIFEHLQSFDVVLGSGSPRRKEMLERLGLSFRVVTGNRPELLPDGVPLKNAAEYLANQKAEEVKQKLTGNYLLITSDTIVLSNNLILGKPADLNEAKLMLQNMSGRNHEVITGVSITSATHSVSFSQGTRVQFRSMDEEEIEYYVNNYPVLDKAGAYGIQDWIGLSCITSISGSFYNVMGLPVHKVYEVLREWGEVI